MKMISIYASSPFPPEYSPASPHALHTRATSARIPVLQYRRWSFSFQRRSEAGEDLPPFPVFCSSGNSFAAAAARRHNERPVPPLRCAFRPLDPCSAASPQKAVLEVAAAPALPFCWRYRQESPHVAALAPAACSLPHSFCESVFILSRRAPAAGQREACWEEFLPPAPSVRRCYAMRSRRAFSALPPPTAQKRRFSAAQSQNSVSRRRRARRRGA